MKLQLPKSVAVISDGSQSHQIYTFLKARGIERIESYQNGHDGFNAILAGNVESLVLDWGLTTGITAPAMITRIKRLPELHHFPVVILTSSANKQSASLIQDYVCVKESSLPLNANDLLNSLHSVLGERAWFLGNVSKIEATLQAVPSNPEQAGRLITNLLDQSPNPTPVAMVASRVLCDHGKHLQAVAILNHVLKQNPSNLQALNAVARAFYSQGRTKDAFNYLKKAHALAPENIDRLSLLGELEVSLKQPEAAIKRFQDALGMDQHYIWSKVGLSVASSIKQESVIASHFGDEEPSIAKVINNLGVFLAQEGDFEKAIKYYMMAFAFLASEDLQAKVSFNMGLGFLKWGKESQGKYWFERSNNLSHGNFSKASKYLQNLKQVVSKAGLITDAAGTPMRSKDIETAQPIEFKAATGSNIVPIQKQPVFEWSKPSTTSAIDLDEESSGVIVKINQKSASKTKSSLDRMIDEIDNSLKVDILKKKIS
ncbi:MAG: tetratricopeptide repeat protein [Proteobacteria bacterium]|nr:tetratricopeptide repeat protein [Pseudomonadota bacterium]